jgi:hypothetical protein
MYYGKNPFAIGVNCNYNKYSMGTYTNIFAINSATLVAMAGPNGIGTTGTFVIENVSVYNTSSMVTNYMTEIASYGGNINLMSYTLTNISGVLYPMANSGLGLSPYGSVYVYGANLVPQSGYQVGAQTLGGIMAVGSSNLTYWSTTYSQTFVMAPWVQGGYNNASGATSSGTITFSDGTVQSTAYTGPPVISTTTNTLSTGTYTAVLSTSGIFTAPSLTVTGQVLFTNLTNDVGAYNQSTGRVIWGGVSQTGEIRIGQPTTVSQTINIANAAITTGNTQTINIGAGGPLGAANGGATKITVGNISTLTQNQILSGIQLAPTTSTILTNAGIALGGGGGNYLAIGQYPIGATFAGNNVQYGQWLQSGYSLTATYYPIVLNPLGGAVIVPGGGTVSKASTSTLALNTSLTLDNLAVQIKTQSSGVWIALGTVSGTTTYYYSLTYQTGSGVANTATGTTNSLSATTTPALIGLSTWFFSAGGQTASVVVTDTTAAKMYRITWMTTSSSSPYGNYITIERV